MRRSGKSLGYDRLKGLRRFHQDGVYYVYHRASGIRMPDVPENDTRFLAAYMKAQEAISSDTVQKKRLAAPKTGSLAAAWRAFVRSDDFEDLSEGYRARLNAHAHEILAIGGKVPFTGIRPEIIEKDLADMPVGTTRNAKRMRMKTWRALFAFLKSEGMIEKNYAALAQMPKGRKGEKHKRWTSSHIASFRQRWAIGTHQRLAFEMLLFCGCRLSDAVRIGPGMIDSGGWLRFTQEKTGGEVEIPFHTDLPDFADIEAHDFLMECIRVQKERHMTWIVTAYGSARSKKSASNWMSSACREAGLKDQDRRTAHGLRVTCLTRMAEKEATPHQIGAWGGHQSLKEIEGYTKSAQKRKLLTVNKEKTQNVQVTKS